MTRYFVRYGKRILRYIGRTIGNSFFRTIGKIVAYLLIGLLIYLLFGGGKVNAQTYSGENVGINTTYYDLFNGYIRNLNYNDNYVAFSYVCNYGSYSSNTCYALAYSDDLVFENDVFTGSNVNLVKYDYLGNTRQLQTSIDNNFVFSGDFYYSNLGKSSSLEGGMSLYEKAIILLFSLFIAFYILRVVFVNRC